MYFHTKLLFSELENSIFLLANVLDQPCCINLIYCKSLTLNDCNLQLALCSSSFSSDINHPLDLFTRYISFLLICRSNRSNSPDQFSIISLVFSCLEVYTCKEEILILQLAFFL